MQDVAGRAQEVPGLYPHGSRILRVSHYVGLVIVSLWGTLCVYSEVYSEASLERVSETSRENKLVGSGFAASPKPVAHVHVGLLMG